MKATDKMKAIVAVGYGSPAVLKVSMIDKPVPKASELLVKVVTSSATRADSQMRTGKPVIGRLFTGLRKPKNAVPGTGFAGIVVATGDKVTVFKAGDKVFGETTLGFSTNAEYLTIPESGVILHKPDNMDFTDACTLCDGHLTSINFLKNVARLKKGQKILVNGASGSLGSAAIQLAKYFGAEVSAVCSTRNVGLVKSLGADVVIDYTKEDFTLQEKQYDVIYDTVGKLCFQKCKNSLSKKGIYLSPVLKASLLFEVLLSSIVGSKKAKFGATGLSSDTVLTGLLKEVVEMYNEGKLTSIVDRQFSLEKLAEAHRYIDTGHKKGNIVIQHQTEEEYK